MRVGVCARIASGRHAAVQGAESQCITYCSWPLTNPNWDRGDVKPSNEHKSEHQDRCGRVGLGWGGGNVSRVGGGSVQTPHARHLLLFPLDTFRPRMLFRRVCSVAANACQCTTSGAAPTCHRLRSLDNHHGSANQQAQRLVQVRFEYKVGCCKKTA